MNLEGIPKKITGIAEDNAALLAYGLGSYARFQEADRTEKGLGGLASYLTFQAADGWTPASELMHFLGAPIGGNAATNNILDNIKWKFWNAPHLNTQLFKYSAIAYLAGKYFGLFGGKWLDLAKNVAVGSGLSALTLPSSGAQDQTMPQQAGTYTRSPLQGSTLNQNGMQNLANYQSVYQGRPTAGALYTVASGSRLIGN